MSVTGEDVDQAGRHERARGVARRAAEGAGERAGGHLDESARRDETAEPRRSLLHGRAPLGVSEHRRQAEPDERGDGRVERQRPAEVGELEQEIASAACEGEPLEVRLRQGRQAFDVELASPQDLETDAVAAEVALQLGDSPLHPLGRRGVVRPDVRSRGDRRHALPDGESGQLSRLLQGAGPVVDPGKNV